MLPVTHVLVDMCQLTDTRTSQWTCVLFTCNKLHTRDTHFHAITDNIYDFLKTFFATTDIFLPETMVDNGSLHKTVILVHETLFISLKPWTLPPMLYYRTQRHVAMPLASARLTQMSSPMRPPSPDWPCPRCLSLHPLSPRSR